MGAPDALHGRDADAGCVRHRRARPVRGFGQRRLHRQRHGALGESRIELLDARRPRLVAQQAFEALGGEAFLQAPDAGLGLASLVHDRVRARTLGAQQHDPGAPNMLLWSAPISNQRAKPIKIGGEDGKGNAPSRPPNSHPANQPGIPKGIQNIRFDPLVLSVLWGWTTGSSASAAAIASRPVGPRHLRWPRSD